MKLNPTEQIKAADDLIEELNDQGLGKDLSLRVLIESMAARGLVFGTEPQPMIETVRLMDEMDANA